MVKFFALSFALISSLAQAETMKDAMAAYRAASPPMQIEFSGKGSGRFRDMLAANNLSLRSPELQALEMNVFRAAIREMKYQELIFLFLGGPTPSLLGERPPMAKLLGRPQDKLELIELLGQRGEDVEYLKELFLFEVREAIGDYAGAGNPDVIKRVFKILADIPREEAPDFLGSKRNQYRESIISRLAGRPVKPETPEQQKLMVILLTGHLPLLESASQSSVLSALGMSQRAGAYEYLMGTMRTSRDPIVRQGALLGLTYFADRAEVLSLAKKIAKEGKPGDVIVDIAVRVFEEHFRIRKAQGKPRLELAIAHLRSLFAEKDRRDLQYLTLTSLAMVNEPLIAEFFVNVLKSDDRDLRSLAIERSTWGDLVLATEAVDTELRKLELNGSDTEKHAATEALKIRYRIRCEGRLK